MTYVVLFGEKSPAITCSISGSIDEELRVVGTRAHPYKDGSRRTPPTTKYPKLLTPSTSCLWKKKVADNCAGSRDGH